MSLSTNSDAFKVQKRLMTMTGLWPYRDSPMKYKIFGTIHYSLVVTFAFSLLLSTLVLSEFSKLVQSWSMFVAIINCSIKFTIFYFKMPVFLEVLDFLKSPHFSYYNSSFDKYLRQQIKFATIMTKLFLCSGVTTVILILSAPLLNPQESRQTPLPFPLHLQNHSFIVYLIVYLYQCCALFSAAWTSIGFDNLSTSMMGLSAGYFKILRDTILTITSMDSEQAEELYDMYRDKENKIYQELSDCVGHHVALIKLTETIEDIFTYVFLSQFVCSAAGICLVGFTFVNAEPGSMEFIFALSFLGTLMFQITLYCSFGNEVTLQSSEIRNACYLTEWIYCGNRIRTPLYLIMERSKRPLVLTAGKFVSLSLTSLVAVVKSAVSYAAVLRQMYNK